MNFAHLWRCPSPVTAVAAHNEQIFAGTIHGEIYEYNLVTCQLAQYWKAHSASILVLHISADGYLFSGSGDSLVKVWNLPSVMLKFTLYCCTDVGDVFSLAYIPENRTVYFGTQNASIHWMTLPALEEEVIIPPERPSSSKSHPAVRPSRFFDSAGPGGVLAPQQQEKTILQEYLDADSTLVEIPPENSISFAHFSAVSTMAAIGKHLLATGCEDGVLKLWQIDRDSPPTELYRMQMDQPILSMSFASTWQPGCGLEDGTLVLFDVETFQALSHKVAKTPILSLSFIHGMWFTASGSITRALDQNFGYLAEWDTESLITSTSYVKSYLITGSQNGHIAIWHMPDHAVSVESSPNSPQAYLSDTNMMETLRRLVGYRTVSSRENTWFSECRQCAIDIRDLLRRFGSQADFLPIDGGNPIIVAKFSPKNPQAHIVFYGHYDVIDANDSDEWALPPFKMTSVDGYVHGRGVSDNKGPLVAAIFAVAELYASKELDVSVTFLIEGEEETGSYGFAEAVSKAGIEKPDWVLFSNSYWIDDVHPCLNYGLRGVVHAEVEVVSDTVDRHSGMEGGSSREPTIDMINLLSTLTVPNSGKIAIPNFDSPVLPVSDKERVLYEEILKHNDAGSSVYELMQKWRFPSLTVHRVEVSGPGNVTVIPAKVNAAISLRLVPNQTSNMVKGLLSSFLHSEFAKLKTSNHLKIHWRGSADPWLGDPSNAAFGLLHDATTEVWGVPPLYIREGGSIPVARTLERIFDAPAAQLPCGQSSDGAHLDNERLRITNFLNARAVFKLVFQRIGSRKT